MSGDIAGLYGGNAVPTDRDDAATGDFSPIPPGWYPAEIEKAEVKTTKAGTGKYLWLALTVVGENYANRKLFPRHNLVNPNEKAVEIGLRELAALGQAVGLQAISDTSELIGRHVDVRVKVREEEGRDADNEVSGYMPVGTKSGAAPQEKQEKKKAAKAAPVTAWSAKEEKAAEPAAPAATKRPWEK